MGIFSKFENKMEDTFDTIGDKMFDAPISPVQIAKKAEKQMRRGKMVGAGKQYAPTLYTVLVNPDDDARLSGYYPTLAGETETYLKAKANEAGLVMDGDPLVRFFTDDDLKSGKFDVIAEAVAGAIIEQLRVEEIKNYGIAPQSGRVNQNGAGNNGNGASGAAEGRAPVPPNATGQSYAMSAFQDPGDVEKDSANNSAAQQGRQASHPAVKSASQEMPHDINYQSQQGQARQQFQDQPLQSAQSGQQQNQRQNQAGHQPQQNLQTQEPQASGDFLNNGVAKPVQQDAGAAFAGAVAGGAAGAVAGGVASSAGANDGDNNSVSSSAPTAMFSGGFNDAPAPAPKIPVADIPPAHLRDNATGKVFTLNSPTVVLGRENTCNVVIPDANASRQHAQILFNNGIWMLNDLGSTNGTYINNQEITTRQLNAGDMITIGVTNLQFNIG